MEVAEGDYTIWARDQNFQRIDEVEGWQHLTLDLKWDDMSTWTLELPLREFLNKWGFTGTITSLCTPSGTPNAGGNTLGILVFRNTDITSGVSNNIMSGVINETPVIRDGKDEPMITLNGLSDTYFLLTRQVWPDATRIYDETTHYWKNEATQKVSHSYMNDQIEDIMNGFVLVNLGSGALSYRKLTYFDCEAQGHAGDTVEYWARFESLFDLCKNVLKLQTSTASNYGFDIHQSSDTAATRLYWRFLEPVDKTAEVVFGSEFGTVKKLEYHEARPKYNHCMIGGMSWDGLAPSSAPNERIFQREYDNDSLTMYGRIEGFAEFGGQGDTDATLADAIIDMSNEAKKNLRDNAWNQSIEIELTPTEMAQFMDDFQIGNFVTANVPVAGASATLSIEKNIGNVKVDVTADGRETVTPIICDSGKFNYMGDLGYQLAKAHEILLANAARRK